MKKNYFKIMAAAMLLGMSFGLQSCVDVVGESDNPSGSTEEEVILPAGVTITANGATFGISKLSDITDYLESIKKQISDKAGSEFVIDIQAEGDLATSSDENTIVIPEITDYNVTLNLLSKLNTAAAPLTVKQSGETTSVFKNKINVSFANDDVDLILNLPGTTTTLNNLNSLQILNGLSVVKDGGVIKTFVWAPIKTEYFMNNGDSEWVKVTNASGEEEYQPNVQPEKGDGDSYKFKNLKIVKGEGDYAAVNIYNEEYTLDKLTIAEGAVVVLNYTPYIKEIVGEGNGATVKSSDVWWKDEEKKLVDTDLNLYNVGKITNITIEPLLTGDFKDGTLNAAYVYNAPAAIEKCVFKFGYVSFRDPEAATATVTRCEFEGTGNEKGVTIVAPYQSDKITSFKFSFYKCTFAKGTKFSSEVYGSKPKVDENGEYVYKNYYRWWDFDENGQPDWNTLWTNKSESLDDVPAAAQEVGECNGGWDTTEGKTNNGYSAGYWIEKELQYEDAEYKDYYVYLSFDGCEYDGANIKVEDIIVGYQSSITGVLVRYEIDGKLYRALYDEENKGYTLVPTDK